MEERVYLTVAEVLAIHHRQIEAYGGIHGVRDQGALESAVFRPQHCYYDNLAEEAAALMESLTNNHAFLDGNKRVAFDATHTFLLVNGFTLIADPAETYVFITQSLAQGKFRFPVIQDWMQGHMKAYE